MDAQDQSRPERATKTPWWRRVRVWMMIVILSLPWLYLALLSYRVSEQRRALVAVTRLNGFFQYDFEFSPPGPFPRSASNATPPAPQWLIRLVGIDFFANVASLSVRGSPDDTQWDELSRLSHLEHINLWYDKGTDRDLARLEKLSSLKWVDVAFGASDEAIERLRKALPNLQRLNARRADRGWYQFDVLSTPSVTIHPPENASLPASSPKTSSTAK